ncbi:uncharacterized protein LOC106369680 [Brassica napus]|uniref:uncharacterized protein LOC106369680 n=1 Tax=Brassica napus TaxID=3708 RepID=UPI0006AA5EF5|nr:uncharacterized protein LOC106369680 [Brassica napus]
MLNQAAEAGKFGYHPNCIGVKLTHLSFADDILVFSDGQARSLDGIMEVMDQFASVSGLYINVSKSTVFASGDTSGALGAAVVAKGISVGILPIRYLGFPLTTKTLTKRDYEPLVDKVRSRMLTWSNKSLSFAGRLQLIKSVITSIVNFWSSAFILPVSCLNEIESLYSAFLWSGSPHQSHKAKVAWAELCFPKDEGGLGLRRLRDSATVFSLQLIWRLFTLEGSLWVSWVQHYLLRGSSFWDVKEDHKGSWIRRKLLKLRDLAYPFMKTKILNGNDAFFWFDNWLGQGKIIDITGDAGTIQYGVPRNARVCDAVRDGQWHIRGQRSRHFPALLGLIRDAPVPCAENGLDQTLWRHSRNQFKDHFSASETWHQLRVKRGTVPWSKVVWFAQGIPRYSLITWLAIKNRLSTGDRMRSWGMQQHCTLCGEIDETRDHLFFACTFSYTVLDNIAGRLLGQRMDPEWSDTLLAIQHARFSPLDWILVRMVFQMTIYNVWKERNGRRHQKLWSTAAQITRLIDKTVRNRITSLKYGPSHKYAGLMQRWFTVVP